jgi:hypothetical protein
MISKELAAELITSLSWMERFPHDSEAGKKVLLDTLMELAADDQHAMRIIGDVPKHLDRCPTPKQLTQLAIASVPRYEQDFQPRRRHADEKPWSGDGMFEIWTKRDLALHQHLADYGKTKQAKTYAAQMLKGFEEYMQRHQQKGFASETEAGTIPWNPDVRCHVCNDSGYEYTEIPEPGCVGTVRRCKCKAMFAGVSA